MAGLRCQRSQARGRDAAAGEALDGGIEQALALVGAVCSGTAGFALDRRQVLACFSHRQI
jgi:hypothetical protein